MIVETEGRELWGCKGDSISGATAERLDLAMRTGKAMVCETGANEFLCPQGDSEHSEVAVPFVSHGKSLGAALLLRSEATGRTDQLLVDQLTLLGTFFAVLLDHAHLFEQVFSSRQRWVRVIDAIPVPIIVHNAMGNIVRINRPLADSLRVHPSKLICRPIPEVLVMNRTEGAGLCPLC